MLPVAHLYPAIVHFPIVFVISLAAFDGLATLRGNQILAKSQAASTYQSQSSCRPAFAPLLRFSLAARQRHRHHIRRCTWQAWLA